MKYVVFTLIPYEDSVVTFENYEDAKKHYDEECELWKGDTVQVGIAEVLMTNKEAKV